MADSSSVREFVARLRERWLNLERGWRAVLVAALVVALVVLAP